MPAKAERKARDLKAVLDLSNIIASSPDLDSTLNAACEAAVQLLGASHSSLLLLSSGGRWGRVRAEYPALGVFGRVVRLDEVQERYQPDTSAEPIFISDVSGAFELGAIREYLLSHDVKSILIVPVVSGAEVLGYLSLDSIGRERTYTDEEVELCEIFAAQLAVAVRNSQLYEETKRRAEQLEALRKTALAVTSILDTDKLLREITDQAAALLKAKNGGIFEVHSGPLESTVIVDSSPGGRKKGVTLRPGEGMAGRLLLSDEPYMIVDNYEEWPGRAQVGADRRPTGAVLEVKIMWQGGMIGTLFVEDEVGRKFAQEDAELLMLFALHAAAAMNNAKLVKGLIKGLSEGQENLASLSLAALSLSEQIDPEQVLHMIAEQTLASMECHSVTIWPYDNGADKFLADDLMAVGLSEVELQEFKSMGPPRGGIARAVMREGWLCVPDVKDAADYEFLKNTPRLQLLLSVGIKSFQGVALKVGNESVGVMFANYDYPRLFSEEDSRLMKAQAVHAALALIIARNAQLSEARKQKLEEQGVLLDLSRQMLDEISKQLPIELSTQPSGEAGRKRILKRAVNVARDVLKVECCSIVLPDREGRLLVVAQEGLVNVEEGRTEIGRGRRSQTGYIIEMRNPSRVHDYDKQQDFDPPALLTQNKIRSGMGVPMFRESEVIGAMVVHSRKPRLFTDPEENLLSLIANQTAIALSGAEQIIRQSNYLGALLNASKAISRKGFDRKHVLGEIVEQAYRCLASSGEKKATLSTLQLYDAATRTLFFESAYPAPFLRKLRAAVGETRLVRRDPGGHRIGIVGRAALERKPQLVPNVEEDPDYYKFLDSTRSELAVPLLDGSTVLGVLDIESDQPAAFDALHVKELGAVAEIAVIAIQNARQYDELQKTRREASLALMGMASTVWAHRIRGYANNIRELLKEMRRGLNFSGGQASSMREEFGEKLARLETQATRILELPLTDPLQSVKGARNCAVRGLLEKSLAQLRRNESTSSVNIVAGLEALDENITVRCNPEWLKRAFDILFDNAIKAMSQVEPARRLLHVAARFIADTSVGWMVEIAIADTGPGIPPRLRDKVLKVRVEKSEGESGTGFGLLMARTIFEAYGGTVVVGRTGSEGTMMIVKLPVSEGHFDPSEP
jgi:GAF domain-containing protein